MLPRPEKSGIFRILALLWEKSGNLTSCLSFASTWAPKSNSPTKNLILLMSKNGDTLDSGDSCLRTCLAGGQGTTLRPVGGTAILSKSLDINLYINTGWWSLSCLPSTFAPANTHANVFFVFLPGGISKECHHIVSANCDFEGNYFADIV